MRVFLVGSGGREHALAWKIGQSPLCEQIVVGARESRHRGRAEGHVHPVAADATAELIAAAVAERADLVVCGPEGRWRRLGDAMRAPACRSSARPRAAAEIEGSKAYAKRLMRDAGVPTAAFGIFDDVRTAARSSTRSRAWSS
jgi:phosphoribosylamine--glycine ligase